MATTIESIDEAIANVIAISTMKYEEGDVVVDYTAQLRELRLMREELVKNPAAEMTIFAFDYDIDDMGEDHTQVEP